MKKTQVTKVIDEYSEDCTNCGQTIKGRTENQVNYWMKVHKLSKNCREHKK